MSQIKEIWDVGAAVYDEQVRYFLPYHRSHEVIIDLLPKAGTQHVLDLGSGTGIVSEKILKAIPSISITCVDFSASMINESKRRLAPFGSRVDYVCADFAEWNEKRNFDAIVTCNAFIYKGINVEDCYSKYADWLTPGGLFLNSTIVTYKDYACLPNITDNFKPSGTQSLSKEAADFAQGPGKVISHCGEDSLLAPLPIGEHIEAMNKAGLKSFCVWQYLFQAIVIGVKNTEKKSA